MSFRGFIRGFTILRIHTNCAFSLLLRLHSVNLDIIARINVLFIDNNSGSIYDSYTFYILFPGSIYILRPFRKCI